MDDEKWFLEHLIRHGTVKCFSSHTKGANQHNDYTCTAKGNISLGMLTEMRSKMNKVKSRKYQGALPKFKMESSFELEHVLPHMGITDIFNPTKAD